MSGVIGVQQVAREGKQLAAVLGQPVLVDGVELLEPGCRFGLVKLAKSGVTQI